MVADESEVSEPYVATYAITFYDVDTKLMTRQHYHVLNTKLDSITRHAETFSTSNFQNMVTVHQGVMQTLQYETARIFGVEQKLNSNTIEKVDKVVSDVKLLFDKVETALKDVHDIVDKKLSEAVNSIKEFYTHFTYENEAFLALRFALNKDNVDHHTSVSNSIMDLQINYKGGAKLMDTIVAKTQKIMTTKQ
ncbi:unnamed protein product [Lactuca virosa]|uniref:Uncharacterized protein n=1 Tax=Lactuca virosa TaxID=75947 RepID=A0AAU9MJR2_9ASTR|nr:unnamed protein product [Lactuca virosa]